MVGNTLFFRKEGNRCILPMGTEIRFFPELKPVSPFVLESVLCKQTWPFPLQMPLLVFLVLQGHCTDGKYPLEINPVFCPLACPWGNSNLPGRVPGSFGSFGGFFLHPPKKQTDKQKSLRAYHPYVLVLDLAGMYVCF